MIRNLLFLLLLHLFAFSSLVYAQSNQGAYLKIDYIKVDSEFHEEFLEYIEGELSDFKDRRIAETDVESWRAYRVLFPSTHGSTYNYVSVTVSSSMGAFDFYDDQESDFLSYQLVNNRFEVPHSEIWRVRNSLLKDDYIEPSNYMMLDFMNVAGGRELEYQMLEDEVALPIHEERMNRDIMEAWEMYELITPGGLNYGYNFATGNYFTKLEHIEYGFDEELIRSQNPQVNIMEFFENIRSTRDLVQSEVWKLLHYITK